LVAPTRAINGRSSLPVNGSCVDAGDTDAVAATVVPTAAAPAVLRPRLNCSPSTCPEPPADPPADPPAEPLTAPEDWPPPAEPPTAPEDWPAPPEEPPPVPDRP